MMQKGWEGSEICAVYGLEKEEGKEVWRENINTMAYMNAGWVAKVCGVG